MADLALASGGSFTTDLLLGVDRLPPAHVRAYGAYFLEVIRQRGFPLHTASLWNALYFGWSTERASYLGRGFRLVPADDGHPLPVGSFVEVALSGTRDIWAEVVYKEGRDPERINALGEVEPAASGARLGLVRARQDAAVREALVLDYGAFGAGLADADADDFARALRRGRLTTDFHKEVFVCYPAADAGADDLTLFARHVMSEYGDDLFDEFLADRGAGVGRDVRWELLLGSLAAVHELVAGAPGIRTFGAYHLDGEACCARLATSGVELFGGDAVRSIVGAIVEPPARRRAHFSGWAGSGTAHPTYRATGALVREYLGRHGRDAPELRDEERDLLAGPGLARLVLEVNLAVADRIGEQGLLHGSNVHVRLDDEWQAGGTWRAVRYEDAPPPEARFGPLVPLGMGYAEASGEAGLDTTLEPGPEPVAERSERSWRVPLRLIDLHHLDLPLDPAALAMLPPDACEVLVEFSDGTPGRRRPRPLDRARRLVRQMPYPVSLVPGTYLTYTLGFGGLLLTTKVTPLAVPIEIEGRSVRFEFNEALLRREIGLAPIDSRSLGRSRTLTDQINEVFRRRGRPTTDGGRALRAEEVVAALLGPESTSAVSLTILLHLQAGDFEYRVPEYVWFARISPRTSPRERVRILASREGSRARIERILAPRMVPMGIRRYTAAGGRRPSREKIATYAMARTLNRAEHRLPERLGPGESWVVPYALGAAEEPSSRASLWDE
jgi:hypothetical protein